MKSTILATLFAASLIAFPAFADTPNRTNMSFKQFVEASGCVIVDKGGYSNLAAVDGGNCPFDVTQAWRGNSSKIIQVATAGTDGIPGNADDGFADVTVSDN